MMKKSGSIIEAAAGAVIFVIGLVLCFHNYVQKGNTAYAVSLLVAIAGVIVLIAGICNIVSKGERKPVDTKVLAQAALCAALCYVGATFIKIDVPVGTEKTMFHFGNVFCVLAALLIGGAWGGLAGAVGMTISDLTTAYVTSAPKTFILKLCIGLIVGFVAHKLFHLSKDHSAKYVTVARLYQVYAVWHLILWQTRLWDIFINPICLVFRRTLPRHLQKSVRLQHRLMQS